MRLPRLLLLIVTLAACADARVDAHEARLAELTQETERLARDLADLRAKGGSGGAAAPRDDATATRLRQVDAMVGALLEQQQRDGTGALTGTLPGVWRETSATSRVLHLAPDGRLCGWELGADRKSREPFWGRWERHGAVLVQLRDRWVGDHNEVRVVLGGVEALSDDALTLGDTLAGTNAPSYTRVPTAEWPALASLEQDRVVPIPGLPAWCLKDGAPRP